MAPSYQKLLAFFCALPLAAQSLSLSCPPPQKFNQPAVCTANFSGGAVSLQWVLTTTPRANITVTSLVSGKSIAAGANGLYMLIGGNANPISGAVASVTVPAHSGSVTLTLSKILGSSASGHAVQINPGVSIRVQ